jgi:hypothetical protein
MQGKPERRAEERRGSDRRMLAVGKRVQNRWLIGILTPSEPSASATGRVASGVLNLRR